MAEAERTREAGETRAEIIRHAVELFSHYGFWKTNLSDIAKRCGMSPANLYRYFRNKQAIGLAVVETHFEEGRVLGETALAAAGGDPEARIRAVLRAGVAHVVESMDRNPKLVELADFVCEDEEGWALLQSHIRWRRARIMEALDDGVARGLFAVEDTERTAIAIQHAVKAFNLPFALARWRDRSTVLPELEPVLDLIVSGLRAARHTSA